LKNRQLNSILKTILFILALFTIAKVSATQLLTLANDKIQITVAPQQGGELSGFAVNLDDEFQQLLYRANDYKKQTNYWLFVS